MAIAIGIVYGYVYIHALGWIYIYIYIHCIAGYFA